MNMEEIIREVLTFFGTGILILIILSAFAIGLFALILKIIKIIRKGR